MEPVDGFGIVLFNSAAKVVKAAQDELCISIPLGGGFIEPVCRFRIVLLYDMAVIVNMS